MIKKAETHHAKEIQNLVSSLSHFYLINKKASLPSWFLNTIELSEFQQRLINPNFANYVYTEDNVIIGYISIKDKSHLYHLFVDETFHGKGIAKKLWNHILTLTNTTTYTVRSSIFAIPVYKRIGFKESGIIQTKDNIQFQSMQLKIK